MKGRGCNLEGGRKTFLEGLEVSCIPCTTRLSVPGFLAVLDLFLPGRRLFPEGERTSFLGENPSLFDNRTKSDISVDNMTASTGNTGSTGRLGTGRLPTSMVGRRAYTGGGYYPPWYASVTHPGMPQLPTLVCPYPSLFQNGEKTLA